MKPIVLSFCSPFSTVTLHKTKTFLHILDNEPMKTFGSGQSSMIKEPKTKDCAGLRPFSTSRFAPLSDPLKFAEFHNHSPLLTVIPPTIKLLVYDHRSYERYLSSGEKGLKGNIFEAFLPTIFK